MLEKDLHERASYLRDAIFSASDGIITTFAVVTGSAGALLSPRVVVILGFANLLADGFSMASGTYMGVKSEMEFEKAEGDKHSTETYPLRQSLVTFLAFDIAGLLPLVPYLFGFENALTYSVFLVGLALTTIGLVRGYFTRKNPLKSASETLFIGGIAAVISYFAGFAIDKVV